MLFERSIGSVCNNDYKDQTAVAIIRDCLKIAEDDDEIYDIMVADLLKMQHDMTDMALNRTKMRLQGYSLGTPGKVGK